MYISPDVCTFHLYVHFTGDQQSPESRQHASNLLPVTISRFELSFPSSNISVLLIDIRSSLCHAANQYPIIQQCDIIQINKQLKLSIPRIPEQKKHKKKNFKRKPIKESLLFNEVLKAVVTLWMLFRNFLLQRRWGKNNSIKDKVKQRAFLKFYSVIEFEEEKRTKKIFPIFKLFLGWLMGICIT